MQALVTPTVDLDSGAGVSVLVALFFLDSEVSAIILAGIIVVVEQVLDGQGADIIARPSGNVSFS